MLSFVVPDDGARQLRRTHLLLTVQSVVVLLVAVNRLTRLTTGYVAANEFLRWVDLLNMLVLPVVSVLALYALRRVLRYPSPALGRRADVALAVVFVVGVYLLAAGYGDHEVTNYLHIRFCDVRPFGATDQLCQIIVYNDDQFSHLVFFIGFILLSLSVLLLPPLFPALRQASGRHLAALAANAVVFALGIFANLAFEELGLDLYVVAIVALVSAGLWWRRRREPLLIYYVIAYWLGLLGTAAYQLTHRA